MKRAFERRSSSGKPTGTRISEMRTAKWIYLLLLLPVAVSPLSCRGVVKNVFRSPKVRLIDVALLSNPLADPGKPWDAVLSLEVDNRNDYPLEVAYVAYSAIFGRDTIAGGEHREDIRLGASGITVVKVPVSFRPEAFLNAAKEAFFGRTVTYEFNGSVGLRTPVVGVVRIPFSRTGRFNPTEFLRQKGLGFN
jgi:LEA14-like dessication related protein